eukprot:CAMPEP_0113628580 /NCGR_PEP_ID=MMETSP0017_2-20120614/14810_1 /TAXON_ID=2856 /ORGANISM="Cylindrotheca closterium" /LENGTH=640 /DNA_ID=CAMNT_0000538893 /DNA_START=18 /DNA_END=1940 /DNA_ORIENTATION=- /assembly_acc=CAM_ASM_000147
MKLSALVSEDSEDSFEILSSESLTELSKHDEFVIRQLLMNGLNLSQVIEIYKGRLSESNIVAVARKLLIEIGSERDPEGQGDDADSEESLVGNGRINKNRHFCDIALDVLRRSPCDLVMESELLEHHIINLSQSAPEDFYDPIFSNIMRDPVVLSSGFIVDRSTAIEEGSGALQFRSCPWSRKPLDRKVYPALRLKRKLNEFKSGRVNEMMATASLLLNAKNERDFCKVIVMAQEFVEDIGPNGHRTLANQLAQLGLSTLDLEPSDTSRLSILQPSLLTKQLLMLYALKLADLVESYLPSKALKMSEMAQKAIDTKQFDEAEEWLAYCDQIQDQCRDMLAGNKEIPVAPMKLDLAKKRGDSDLVPFQRRVYFGFLRNGKTAAAQRFLEQEGLGALDLRDLSPCFFRRSALSSSISDDAWHEGARCSALEGGVSHIFVTAKNFRDQDWGNQKGRLGLSLYSPDDELVARCNLFGTYRTQGCAFNDAPFAYRLLEADQEVVSKCTPGCYYKFEFTVGGGGGHRLDLDSFVCKIFYKEWFAAEAFNGSYRMHDPEGDAGVFLGSVNEHGVAHGKGRLEYDDRITFIGTFADGLMLEGTNYFNGQAVHTMVGGSWTPGSEDENPDASVVARFPLDVNDLTETEA